MQFTHPLTRIAGNCTFCARPRRPRKWVQLRRRPAERAINTWATGAWCHHHCVVLNYVDSGALEAALRSCLKWATFRPTRPSPFLTRKHGHKSTWPRWVLVGWKKKHRVFKYMNEFKRFFTSGHRLKSTRRRTLSRSCFRIEEAVD